MDIEKNFKIAALFEIYGILLTDRQREIMQNYYELDLSLSEISENLKISRSAVLDAIQNSSNLLQQYEDKLHLKQKDEKIANIVNGNYTKEQIIEILKELL
jgi:predicted DNA-binding protein YlxM (UPF0122 family)